MTAAELTALQYRHQLSIRAECIRNAYALWQTFDPSDRTSWDRMVTLALPILQARYGLSAGVASRYFEQMALMTTGRPDPAAPAPVLPEERVRASLAATGLVGTIRARSAGLSPQAAKQVGFVRFSGGFGRLALLGGRTAIVASVYASTRATRWTRVTSGDPCAFCADLADEPSSADAFEAHDHCSCTAEPHFT